MIVEQPEAFKTWLTAVLKPLCDADPAALAKYVLALVKRDKTEEELQKIMVGQLQVFLENETESFVALVLRTLETQDYVPAPVIPNANPPNPIVKATSSSTATTAAASSPIATAKETTTTTTSTTKPIIVPPSELPNLNEPASATTVNGSSLPAVAGSTAATGGGAKKEHESATVATPAAAATTAAAGAKRDRESRKSEAEKEDKPPSRSVRARLQHRSTSRNRSRSRSWDRSKQRSKSRERDLDSKPSHRLDSGSSRSDNKRERPRAWRNKSPPMRRFLDRRRSRTPPSPMLSGRERDRGLRSRSRSPLPPKHSRSSRYNRNRTPPRSLSRSRSRSRSLEKRERRDSIKDKESTNKDGGHSSSRPVTPTPDSNHGGRDRDRDNDPDFRLGGGANSLGQTLQSVVVAQQQPTSTTGNKRRCRDFDEKGYCMRGEMCPFDHGCDPVVLEDSALTSVLTYNPNGAGGAAAVIAGDVVGGGPPPPLGVGIGPMLNAAAGPGHPLMVPGHHPRGIIPPEYNPQAPQMWNRGGGGPPGFRGPRPMGMPRGPMMGGFPPPPHMQRELIPVPVMDNKPHHHHQQQHMHNPQQHHHHHPHHHPYASGPPGGVGGGGMNPMMGGFRPQMAYNTGPARSSLGGLGAKNPANCSLELKKIPPGLNSITHLNNHFSKFGKPVNIQVNYEGDPEAAIVTFSSHAEANAAYRSTEAVLNNRFIKVFWHNANADGKQENVPPPQRSIKDRLGKPTIVPPNTNKVLNLVQPRAVIAAAAAAAAENNQVATETNNNNTDSSGNEKSLNPPGVTTPTAPHLNNNNNNNDNNNGNNSASPTATTHREETKAQQAAAIKKGQELLAAKEKLKKNQDEQRKEVLRIKNNLRKRKQELLEKQLSQQKILIEKMEKLPPGPQRDLVLETIKKTQESIEEIKKDLLQSVLLSKAAAANTPLTAQQQQQAALAQKRLNSISKDDVQREMLDAELDLITKQQEGADTTEIQKRLAELRAKAAMAMAARNSGGGGGGGRGRGRVGGRFNPVVSRHLLTKNNLIDNNSGLKGNIKSVNRTFQKHTVDHRPTRLLVSGYEGDEQESVLSHFQTFGVIVDYVTDSTLPSITLNYKTRKEAEMALLKGKNFQDRTLSITWCTGVPLNNPMTSRPNPRKVVISESEEDQLIEQSVPEGDEDLGPEISEEVLLQDDEEEEDESEDRSWRR